MNKGYLVLVACAVLFTGCKKEKRTSEEWRELAEAKLNEIETLVATIPCSQQNKAVIEGVMQYCGEIYYPVTSPIKSKFDRLRREYQRLSKNQWGAFGDEGGVIDCFGRSPQPIRIGCEDNKLLVYTARNLPLEEAQEMASDLHAKIQHYKDTVSCDGNQRWGYEVVWNLESDELEVLPLFHGVTSPQWADVFSDYQIFVYRIREAAGIDTYPRLSKQPKGVACEDGKPVIEYEAE